MQTVLRAIGTFFFAFTVGTVGGMLVLFLILIGKLRVRGYWKLWGYLREGGKLIVANHPSLMETFLLPVMMWPWGVFWLKRFFLWSVPAFELLPQGTRWIYSVSHCIPLRRGVPGGAREATLKMREVLTSGGNITIHPEEGRTDSPDRKSGQMPEQKHYAGRTMRKLHSQVHRIAQQTKAEMVPIWVDIPFREKSNGFLATFQYWFLRRERVTLYIGDKFTLTEKNVDQANKQLRHHIMGAGLS